MALVAGGTSAGFDLYIVPDRDFTPTSTLSLGVPAWQVAWNPNGTKLAVMEPDQASSQCSTTATGSLIVISPKNLHHPTTLVNQGAAHPVWQPLPGRQLNPDRVSHTSGSHESSWRLFHPGN